MKFSDLSIPFTTHIQELFTCLHLGRHMRFPRMLLAAVALLLPISAMAQVTTGTIAGTVKDSSGAVVSNATVTITDTDKGAVVRTIKTGTGGDFSAPLLPVSHYALIIDASGFRKYSQS